MNNDPSKKNCLPIAVVTGLLSLTALTGCRVEIEPSICPEQGSSVMSPDMTCSDE